MAGEHPQRDYVFVSDLHLSLGYDPDRRAYHPREDFFFDEVFFRWLRWLDAHCVEGRRWELVFVGDVLDFFPVDQNILTEYFRAVDHRREDLDSSDHRQVVRHWERQFSSSALKEPLSERVQRLMFEDDVLKGRVRLAPASTARKVALSAEPAAVPDWAVQIYRRYWPQADQSGGRLSEPLILRAPTEGEATAYRLARKAAEPQAPLPWSQQPQIDPLEGAAVRDEAFERRYGFLPTPERSADKLSAIYAGHPVFFRALAWFVGHGHRVVFLRGNHDLELYWPLVQDRFREFVAREYESAFRSAIGYDPLDLVPPDFSERVVFEPGWFYYRPGVFYAEHGCQYEPFSASANPIRPLLPGSGWLLNPDVGSLAVLCLHNHLESQHPAWDNEANYVVFLREMIRREPVRTLVKLVRHGSDFIRMAERLWLAGSARENVQVPGRYDFASYASLVGLEPRMVRNIHEVGARPLLLHERLAWFLFSPEGHVLKVLALLGLGALTTGSAALWYLVLAPALSGVIPGGSSGTVGSALQLLVKILLWLLPPGAYALVKRWLARQHSERFLFQAARRIFLELSIGDPDLRYVIHGHDHQPDTRPIARTANGRLAYYMNTGSWTPVFAEGERRLRTLGREVEFTFVQLVRGAEGYAAQLLRWNDDAGRPERQMVPPADASDAPLL